MTSLCVHCAVAIEASNFLILGAMDRFKPSVRTSMDDDEVSPRDEDMLCAISSLLSKWCVERELEKFSCGLWAQES